MKQTQEQKILKFLANQKKFVPIYDLIRFGLDKFIVNTSRKLPKMAETNLVESRLVNGKTYKEWKITKSGLRYLKHLELAEKRFEKYTDKKLKQYAKR